MTRQEIEAIELFNKLGRDKVLSEINRIGDLSRNRYLEYVSTRPDTYLTELNFMEPEERDYIHLLKTGYMCCVDEVSEAKARIQLKIAMRKEKRNKS